MRTLIVVIALHLVVIQQPVVVCLRIQDYCLFVVRKPGSTPRLQRGVNGFEFVTHIFDNKSLYISNLHSRNLHLRYKTNHPSLPLALKRGVVQGSLVYFVNLRFDGTISLQQLIIFIAIFS